MKVTKTEALAIGRQWAMDRKATGTNWGYFLLTDALPVVGGDQDLAYVVCDEATRVWEKLKAKELM